LPEQIKNDFQRSGLSPSLPGCKRRFPRVRCRDFGNLVGLEYGTTLPSLPRAQAWFGAYITDMGRTGIGMLHGEPLYPRERMRVLLRDGKVRQIEVVRCERIDECCFSIGARFVESP
jgi:hypothetical protein